MAINDELFAALVLERARANYLIKNSFDPNFVAWDVFGDGEIRGVPECEMSDLLQEAAKEFMIEVEEVA
ncbi:hypothetical protein M0R72_21565 [Candidatus Pacearchaeota archaeon]|jgi:hypothetical protein|nr:hypothetical protein [Candidatus Pacearchaeota archaeon]